MANKQEGQQWGALPQWWGASPKLELDNCNHPSSIDLLHLNLTMIIFKKSTGGDGAMEHPKTVVGTFPKEMETRMAPRLNGISAHLTLNKTWNTAILFLLEEEKQHGDPLFVQVR